MARSPIGAGDAFAAALTLRLEAGAPLDDAVSHAAAVAAAHVESADGRVDGDRVIELTAPGRGATGRGATAAAS